MAETRTNLGGFPRRARDPAFDDDRLVADPSFTEAGDWIAGIVFLAVVAGLVFGIGSESMPTAGTPLSMTSSAGSIPSTTGSGSGRRLAMTPAPDYRAPAPASPSTTR
jgi:hypothetical protein